MMNKTGIALLHFDDKDLMDSVETKFKDLSASVSFNLIQEKTIKQNIKAYNIARNEKIKFNSLKEKCTELGLDDFDKIKQKRTRYISNIECKKIVLAILSLSSDKVIVLNDSFFNKDIYYLIDFIKKISENKKVVILTSKEVNSEFKSNSIIKIDKSNCNDIVDNLIKDFGQSKKKTRWIPSTFLTMGQKWLPLIFCFLTLISSFFLIGDSAVLITTDPVIKEIDLMYDNQYKDVLLHADTYADFYFGGTSSFYNISSNQVKKVEEYLGFNNTYEIKHINEDDITNKCFSFIMRDDNDEHVYYVSHFYYLSPKYDYSFMKVDNRINKPSNIHIPNNKNEIALDSLTADKILKHGYYDNDGNKVKINDVNELIGATLSYYKVTGIYTFKNQNYSYPVIYKNELDAEEILFNAETEYLYYILPEDKNEMVQFIKSMRYKTSVNEFNDYHKNKVYYYGIAPMTEWSSYTSARENDWNGRVIPGGFIGRYFEFVGGLLTSLLSIIATLYFCLKDLESYGTYKFLNDLGIRKKNLFLSSLIQLSIVEIMSFAIALISISVRNALSGGLLFSLFYHLNLLTSLIVLVMLIIGMVVSLGITFIKLNKKYKN